MNILHMKYALEVARCGSINKAAEALLMNQPNLSRSIRELEASLGVPLFSRSAKGMEVTPDGEMFLRYAEKILKQVDEVENMFRNSIADKKRFSVSVPRAGYICDAFANFSKAVKDVDRVEIFYKETNSKKTLKNLLEADYKLGIIRYAENFDRYYKSLFEEKGLSSELVTEFSYVLVFSEKSPLAKLSEVKFSDLADLVEIAHADPYVPSLSFAEVKREELPDKVNRRIFVFERASQMELLSRNPDTFMWVSKIPDDTLEKFGLVCRECPENRKVYKDVIVHRKDYRLTNLDCLFIEELCASKRRLFG